MYPKYLSCTSALAAPCWVWAQPYGDGRPDSCEDFAESLSLTRFLMKQAMIEIAPAPKAAVAVLHVSSLGPWSREGCRAHANETHGHFYFFFHLPFPWRFSSHPLSTGKPRLA